MPTSVPPVVAVHENKVVLSSLLQRRRRPNEAITWWRCKSKVVAQWSCIIACLGAWRRDGVGQATNRGRATSYAWVVIHAGVAVLAIQVHASERTTEETSLPKYSLNI